MLRIKAATFELLYGKNVEHLFAGMKYGSERIDLKGPDLIEILMRRWLLLKEKLKEARSRHKIMLYKHRRDLEFSKLRSCILEGFPPFRGVKTFWDQGQAQSSIALVPFEILERNGEFRIVGSSSAVNRTLIMSLSEEPESHFGSQEQSHEKQVIPFVKILFGRITHKREATWRPKSLAS
ncbi:hypothetical protein Tco_0011288 [Tanacetum coccineum]